MASLIEELIATLEDEGVLYEELLPLAGKKTKVIVSNDLEELARITERENAMVDRLTVLEKKRQEVVNNIAVVLNRNADGLDLKTIVSLLDKQPEEQRALKRVHDKLKEAVNRLKEVNFQNKQLIEESLEMIEFNMNFIQSTRMSSGSSNYTKSASINDPTLPESGMFDAKQ